MKIWDSVYISHSLQPDSRPVEQLQYIQSIIAMQEILTKFGPLVIFGLVVWPYGFELLAFWFLFI